MGVGDMAGMRLGKGVEFMPNIEFPKPEAMGDPGMKGVIGLWWGGSCPSETRKMIFSSPCLLWRRETQGSLCRHYCLSCRRGRVSLGSRCWARHHEE